MIGWQFRRIRKAQELIKRGSSGRTAGMKCNVPAFYIERFIKEIKSFTARELDRNVDYLSETDYSIKRSQLKPQEALELLIIQICSNKTIR